MAGTFATAPAAAELPAQLLAQVCQWATHQRWYPGEAGTTPAPWLVGRFTGFPELVIFFARLDGPPQVIIQIPLLLAPAPVKEFEPIAGDDALIAIALLGGAPVAVYDAAGSQPAWRAYLANMEDPETVAVTDTEDSWQNAASGAHLLTGEQSNSSVLLPGMGVIMKILRTLVPGEHPDVEVPRALTDAGYRGVPRYLGSTNVELPEFGRTSLAIATELVPNAADGFELAVQYAETDRDFSQLAAEFGKTLAALHAGLAKALPTDRQLDPATFLSQLRDRADAATAEAPVLANYSRQVQQVYDQMAASLHPVPLQRIHGDFHLGQALHASDGWRILDFEGEPLRPAEQRSAPDLPLRDVAGALRSFDYAAAVAQKNLEANPATAVTPEPSVECPAQPGVSRPRPSVAPKPSVECPAQPGVSRPRLSVDPSWATNAKRAFLEAYFAELGSQPDAATQQLLDALVLDKALYEVVYESRQRPTWVGIPLQAVEQIAKGA